MSAPWRLSFIGAVLACLHLPAQAGVLVDQAVCNVRLSPGQLEGMGRSGGLVVSTKQTYAECSDEMRTPQVTYFCSTGPTSPNCPLDTRAHYSEAALMAVYSALTESLHALERVDIFFEGNFTGQRGMQVRINQD
ncbi:MAG: hypothetical protein IPK27_06430 [Rhodanobacteraceae bacterium]|nr:hypothetical protein [Rhodanobacteraceae bacterium]